MNRFIFFPFLLLLLVGLQSTAADEATTATPKLAPGYGSMGYALPAAGSYELPVIRTAADATVINENGETDTLYNIFDNKYVLLSFMYRRCSDVNGCPLSAFVMYSLKSRMQQNPELARSLKMISLSFDPENDTPDAMRQYGENFRYAGKEGSWHFLTTQSARQLQPILKSYNQDLQRKLNKDGDPSNDFSHLLRVFLIDPEKNIRNIYSVAFLHADLIERDFSTLRLAEKHTKAKTQLASLKPVKTLTDDQSPTGEIAGLGDLSAKIEKQLTAAEKLLQIANKPGAGLPAVPLPDKFELTAEKIALGKQLFFDRRLSLNNTISCAMCHVPEQGFTSNELATAVGIEGRTVRRNTPTLYNIAYAKTLFHDGREDKLSQQAWNPLLARNEMGNPSVGYVINKIALLPEYQALFSKAFGEPLINMQTVGDALAAYQMTLVSANSAFDQWQYGGKDDAMSAAAREGFTLFTGKAGCNRCHTVSSDQALFSDFRLHNTGLGYEASMKKTSPSIRVQLAPGIFTEVDSKIVKSVSETVPNDLGLYEITENPIDRWKFRTPTLRNVALTAPYMHNGAFSTLHEVIDFYNQGGIKNPLLSPLIQPLNLSTREKKNLEAFLLSLTGDNVATLVADAFAADVGDVAAGDQLWSPNYNQQ